MNCTRAVVGNICLMGVWLACAFIPFNQGPTAVAQSGARSDESVERGISGSYPFRYSGPRLRVKTQRDADAALLVRLHRLGEADQYEALFIGTREGTFDLSQSFEHADGSVVAELPAMPVSIISTLPKDQRSDLFAAVDFEPRIVGGYRTLIVFAVIGWLCVPLVVMAVGYFRRPAYVPEPPPPPEPTWGERLSPLLTAAATRPLTADEQASLELMLLHYWRERSSLESESMADSISRLRQHGQAGPAVRAVEAWLHQSQAGEVQTLAAGDGSSTPDLSSARLREVLRQLQALQISAEGAVEDEQVAAGGRV